MSEPKINSLDDISNLVRALRDYEKNEVPIALVSLMRTLDMYAYFIKIENIYVKAEVLMKDNKPIVDNIKHLRHPLLPNEKDLNNMVIYASVFIKDNPHTFNCLRIQVLVLHKNEGEMINLLEDNVVIKDVDRTYKN